MKKLFPVAVIALGLMSCGGPSPEQYKKGADAMCKCMNKKVSEREESEYVTKEAADNLDYSLCALDVVLDTRVDPNTEDFVKAMEANCSDYVTAAKAYLSDN
ncbi:MAG: hypothetical protein MRY83_11710 [Flavobacteriales bacterium]|nr:hypothetical protein [Flavobacteriales bacterium]